MVFRRITRIIEVVLNERAVSPTGIISGRGFVFSDKIPIFVVRYIFG
jgi:hypothetical protein